MPDQPDISKQDRYCPRCQCFLKEKDKNKMWYGRIAPRHVTKDACIEALLVFVEEVAWP